MKVLVALALMAIFGAEGYRQQTVGIRGRLMCGAKPLSDTLIKLWNKNSFGSDDQLAAIKTNSSGDYEISGGIGSLFSMNVHFKIYHDCDDSMIICQRKINLQIPEQYITRTSDVKQWFEAGIMNMEFVFPKEERSCFH